MTGGAWVHLVLSCALAAQVGLAPQAERGHQLFLRTCARCHGEDGKGSGPSSAFLDPRPADLTRGDFAIRSTPSGCAPTDQDLFDRLGLGIPGTAMPAFPRLRPDDRWALVAYLEALAAPHPACKPVGFPQPVPAVDLARGKGAYARLGCAHCHGDDARGAAIPDQRDALGLPVRGTDLTDAAGLRGGARVADIYLRITTGMDGTPMPSFAQVASDQERWQLAGYLASLARPALPDPAGRGRRLLYAMGCAFCHSGVKPDGSYDPARRFGGGQVVEVRPLAAYAPGDLTPAALGGWTDAELSAAIQDGVGRKGHRLDPLAMPWPYYHALSADDARAVVAALRALPSVDPVAIRPRQPPLLVRLRAKLNLLLHRSQKLELVIRPARPDEGGQEGRR